jgi:hypothetical protein
MNAFRNACTVSEAVMEEYVQEIERFKPMGLMGAGSYIYPLARYVQRTKRKLPRIDFIHLHVEVCSRIHRSLIERFLPVRSWVVTSAARWALPPFSARAAPTMWAEVFTWRSWWTANLPSRGRWPLGGYYFNHPQSTHSTVALRTGDLAVAAAEPCTCSTLGHLDVIASIEGRVAEAI